MTIEPLDADILTRLELQRTMAENTMLVLEMETGLESKTLRCIETGAIHDRPRTRVTAAMAKQVRDRRAIWRLASERMQEYEVDALARKYGVHVNTIWRRIRQVRSEVNAAARAQSNYGQRAAA